MQEHINHVFIDGNYRHSGMEMEDLTATKQDFYNNALRILEDTDADHVVYCHIEYDDDDNVTKASFYSYLAMNDETFHKRTKGLGGFIGAVHKH
jgi:hypothetical protein